MVLSSSGAPSRTRLPLQRRLLALVRPGRGNGLWKPGIGGKQREHLVGLPGCDPLPHGDVQVLDGAIGKVIKPSPALQSPEFWKWISAGRPVAK